jgi:probable HAF family extracellular repeat protein
MKFTRSFTRRLGSALLAIAVSSAAQTQAPKPPHYTITDLGTLGGAYSYSYGINEAGVVSGGAATATETDGVSQKGILWNGSAKTNVGTIGGSDCPDCSSEAGGPNSSGVSAVVSETSKPAFMNEDFCGFGTHRQCLGAVWKNGNLKGLPNLKGGRNGQAYWINKQGQLAGFSETGVIDSACASSVPFQVLQFEAVIWGPEGNVRQLKPLPGDTVGFAFGINDKGQAVGASGTCANTSLPPVNPGAPHAVLWESNGTPTDLGSLAGLPFNVANSINNLGEVNGGSLASDGTIHTFLWKKNTGMQDIGTLPGAVVTVAPCCHSLNNHDEMTGFWIDGQGNLSAFYWKNNVITDLNTLISESSGWYLLNTASINDKGQIAGFGVNADGDLHAFLATPCSGTCEAQAIVTGAPGNRRPMPNVPESVRQFINHQLNFARSGAQRIGPQ